MLSHLSPVIKSLAIGFIYLVVGFTGIGLGLYGASSFMGFTLAQDDATEPAPLPPPAPPAASSTSESEPSEESATQDESAGTEEAPEPPAPPAATELEEESVVEEPEAEPESQAQIDPEPEVSSPSTESVSSSGSARFLEPFIYDDKGRRDPFEEYRLVMDTKNMAAFGPLLPLQRFNLEELKLIGILWDVKDPKAMFMDPNNKVHILGKDERIGRDNGYIAVIREGEVVVVETSSVRGKLSYSTKVLKLASNKKK